MPLRIGSGHDGETGQRTRSAHRVARAVPLNANTPVSPPLVSPPFVSIIVPAYNAEANIDACVQSLLSLDYPRDRYEIIVVDNASTDDTARILAKFGGALRVLQERTRGPAAARNAGLRNATYDLLAMTDADCLVDAQWLRELVAPLHHDKVAMVGGRILSVQPATAIERFGEEIHDHEAAITRYVPPYVITMNWASRRSHLESIGYFDERFLRAEDVELSYRFTQAGLTMAYAHGAIVSHHNERTLAGLFREAFDHGAHSRHLDVVHGDWLRAQFADAHGARLMHVVARAARELVTSDDRARAWYRTVFNIGKELGKLMGAARYRVGHHTDHHER